MFTKRGLGESRTKRTLKNAIGRLPRIKIANLPTPLEEAPRFSEALQGPRIFFKRDDLTGLPQSGNKTRMFEFSLAEALNQGAELVFASASVQSNYCRQLAVACGKLGLEVYLLLRNVRGAEDDKIQGNLLLDLLAGARVKIVNWADTAERKLVEKKELEKLRAQGCKNIYVSGETERDTALRAIGYTNCGVEIVEQLDAAGLHADYLYTASLSTTQTGLSVVSKFLRTGWNIVGIDPVGSERAPETMAKIAGNVASILGIDVKLSPDEFLYDSNYVGPGYYRVSEAGLEAMKLVARTEGVFLDPVYSGKAMAALIDHIRNGRIGKGETVIFLHTGGFPCIFAYSDELKLDQYLSIQDQA